MTETLDLNAIASPATTFDPGYSAAWIWAAWLHVDAADPIFLYGCCAPCTRPQKPYLAESIPIFGQEQALFGTLTIRHAVVDIAAANNFIEALAAARIDLSIVLGTDAPAFAARLSRRTIGNVLGHTSATIDAYLTLPPLGELTRSAKPLASMLEILKAQLGMPFTGGSVSRLGNFEVFHLAEWLERQRPFVVEVPRPDVGDSARDRHRLIIARAPAFSVNAHMAHVRCFSGKDTTLDRVCFLAAGETDYAIIGPESIDGFEFRLFSGDGSRLLHTETTHFLLQINTVTTMAGRSIALQDKLSAAAVSIGRKPTVVQSQSSMRSKIGLDGDEDRWRQHAAQLERFTAEHFAPRSLDRWFPRAIESELAVIDHINKVLHGGSITGAILVDPYFGAEALSRLAMRLSSTDIALTVITCLRDLDHVPDTDKPLSDTYCALSVFEDAVKQFHSLINPRLKIINLERPNGDQVFHDRYLMTYRHEGAPIVYMLSNSINKMAGRYPFCMTVLAEDIARAVQGYIEGLSRCTDISHPTQPVITFEWPPQ